jgi:hypothetical protein
MNENEELSLMEHNCHICQQQVLHGEFDTLDETCFITVHKKCKRNYRGSCPVCNIPVASKKCNKFVYVSILSTIGALFITGLVCFFVIVGEKI